MLGHCENPDLTQGNGMLRVIFVDRQSRVRNGWWLLAFLAMTAGMLVPLMIWQDARGQPVPLWQQALIILLVSISCQRLRSAPLRDLIGRADRSLISQLTAGLAIGAALMLLPAFVLFSAGAVSWQVSPATVPDLAIGLAGMILVAATEELLFRGFLFQRLIDGLGAWPAQVIVAIMFLLVHIDNPGMSGAVAWLAGANIFLASILLGNFYLRTRSLYLPFAVHFAANATQGILLGFGVSGHTDSSLLAIDRDRGPAWLTGGEFGLEASLPGLLTLMLVLAFCLRQRRPNLASEPAA